ncbi:MAG: transporter [Vicinamibacterales bacterium]
MRALLIVLLAATTAAAQAPAAGADAPGMVPGRPGAIEAAGIVPAGAVQAELGYGLAHDRSGDVRSLTQTFPGAVVRIGLSPRLELRLAGVGLVHQRVRSRSGSGGGGALGDAAVGVKWLIADGRRHAVDAGLVATLSLPSGTRPASSGGLDPALTAAVARRLPLGVDLSAMARAGAVTRDGARHADYGGGAAVSRALGGGPWSAYGEVVVQGGPGAGPATSVGAGVAGRSRRWLQVDAGLGRGVSGAAPDWTVSVGVVVARSR